MDVVSALLPRFIDPLFDYLEDHLPPPVYAFITNALSMAMALCATAVRLVAVLLQKAPSDWDAQAIIPPIITVLAAYLALASLYRTTSWLFRLTFWVLKWGSLFGFLCTGAGYLAAANGADVGVGLASLGSKALEWLNANVNAAGTQDRARDSTRNRPWTKYDSRTGGYQQSQRTRQLQKSSDEDAEKIIQGILDTANKVFDASWWGGVTERGDDMGSRKGKGRAPGGRASR